MKPKQFFFVALGALVVVAAAGGAGYYYALKYVRTQSNTLATQLAEQKAADDQIETLERLNVQYNKEITPILGMIDQSLPRDKKQTEILAQIERIAAGNGMSLIGVTMPAPSGLPSSVSQTVKAGNVSALPVTFKIDGSYSQLETFTSQLEDLNRFTNITTLTVNRKDGGAEYAFTLNAYIKP
jgi:Tfp pilus assembly protein PilO